MAVLVGIPNQGDDGIRLAGGPSKSCRDIFCLLVGTRMNIAYDFLFRIPVIEKAKIQLIAEKRTPWIGAGATEKNEVIVGLKAGKLPLRAGCTSILFAWPSATSPILTAIGASTSDALFPRTGLANQGGLGCQLVRIGDVVVIGIVGNGDGLPGVSLNLRDVRIAGNELQNTSRI